MSPSLEVRREILSRTILEMVADGFTVISREDTAVVFSEGKKANHILHLLLSIVTFGLWLPVWIIVGVNGRERRRLVSVDENGELQVTYLKR